MRHPCLEVIRHNVTSLGEFNEGLGFEQSESEVVVTVVCGEVSGVGWYGDMPDIVDQQ